MTMRKLRCPERIQCKSIYHIYKNSRRTDELIFIFLSSSKFVRVRHCSARYLKAWAERNARCIINQKTEKRAVRWGIASSGTMIRNAVKNPECEFIMRERRRKMTYFNQTAKAGGWFSLFGLLPLRGREVGRVHSRGHAGENSKHAKVREKSIMEKIQERAATGQVQRNTEYSNKVAMSYIDNSIII